MVFANILNRLNFMDKTHKYILLFSLSMTFIVSILIKILDGSNNDSVSEVKIVNNSLDDTGLKTEMFLPMPKPKSGDWLAIHNEPGQSLKQFINDEHNTPDSIRNVIYLLTIEDESKFEKVVSLEMLREFTENYFSMPVKLLSSKNKFLKNIRTRNNKYSGQKQYHAEDILVEMKKLLPRDAFCVLGISMTDLYPDEKWNFVFGYASFLERVGVFSFARYLPDNENFKKSKDSLFTLRCCKIISHETGHMFGMEHCISYLCNMNGANHLKEFDEQPLYLCPECLSKLEETMKFNTINRYESLKKFYKKIGLMDDYEWIRIRQELLALDEIED